MIIFMRSRSKITVILDLHIHSPYSAATSPTISLHDIALQARRLRIDVMGTGDCLHPAWLENIKRYLKFNKKTGLLFLPDYEDISFIPTVEVNCIWDRTKEAHILLVFPADSHMIEAVRKEIDDYSSVNQQGRPTIVSSPRDLFKTIKSISDSILFIPAHVLTPWYGILGYKIGYKSAEEAFDGFQPDALETGLSASGEMIEMITSAYPLVSNSDAHSVSKIGREVTLITGFNGKPAEISYTNIFHSIKKGENTTIEYPPQLGKYYLTGCRKCGIPLEMNGNPRSFKCPHCKKRIVQGVRDRMLDLKTKDITWENLYLQPDDGKIVTPIPDRVRNYYNYFEKEVKIVPGFDGEFGHVEEEDKSKKSNKKQEYQRKQMGLFK